MRKWWKITGAVLLVPLGAIRGIVDAIGEVQTVSDLPILKWLINPSFSLTALAGATLLGAWAYYDYRIKKEPAGFFGVPQNKSRYRKQAIVGALAVLALSVFTPLIYGHYRQKASSAELASIAPKSLEQPLPNTQTSIPQQPRGGPVSAKVNKPRHSNKKLPPSVAPSVPSPEKQPQDNSVHIENGATIEQTSKGDCSPNIIGGSNAVNCDMHPSAKVTFVPEHENRPTVFTNEGTRPAVNVFETKWRVVVDSKFPIPLLHIRLVNPLLIYMSCDYPTGNGFGEGGARFGPGGGGCSIPTAFGNGATVTVQFTDKLSSSIIPEHKCDGIECPD